MTLILFFVLCWFWIRTTAAAVGLPAMKIEYISDVNVCAWPMTGLDCVAQNHPQKVYVYAYIHIRYL